MNDIYNLSLKIAKEAHKNQVRKIWGNPYIDHLVEVAWQVLFIGGETETVCAGVLHDILEDTEMTEERLKDELSTVANDVSVKKIITIVKAMTQNKTFGYNERHNKQLDNIFIVGHEAMLVLLADYLDNVSNLRRDQIFFGHKLWDKFNQKPEMKFKAIERVIKFLNRYLKTNRSEVEALARLYKLLKQEYKEFKKH